MFDGLTNKQKIISITVITIAIIAIFVYIYNKNNNYNTIDESEILVNSLDENNLEKESKKGEEKQIIIIHIAGEVNNPGVVRIEEGKRIGDAIELAGGLTEYADITEINLAYVLEDGMKIKIPNLNDKENEEYIISDNGNDSRSENSNIRKDKGNMININKATQTELETLQGIGPSLATRIIEYREENGKFNSIEDIKNVSGIGDNKYEAIKDSISVK